MQVTDEVLARAPREELRTVENFKDGKLFSSLRLQFVNGTVCEFDVPKMAGRTPSGWSRCWAAASSDQCRGELSPGSSLSSVVASGLRRGRVLVYESAARTHG